MKPLIGISSDYTPNPRGRPWSSSGLLESYADAITAAGGIPLILPLASATDHAETVRRLDGIILSGGEDIPADAFGDEPHPESRPMSAERWDSERQWLLSAMDANTPCLGICLGMQVMHVVAGGKMIQHIPDEFPDAATHGDPSRRCPHDVEIKAGTKLAALAPASHVPIFSSHHQAIADLRAPYCVAATSPDGIVEAIEDPTRDFLIGVQWHPEREDTQPNWLLQAFIAHCGKRL